MTGFFRWRSFDLVNFDGYRWEREERMMNGTKALIFSLTAMAAVVAMAAEEQFGPFNIDGGKITCKSPSGDEIKKYAEFNVTGDRFIKEGSISLSKISGYAPKENKCEIAGIRKENIVLKSDVGDVTVSVIKGITVFAGADCGTNIVQYAGKTASIECQLSATQIKYTNK
jgi:hypothetical protein